MAEIILGLVGPIASGKDTVKKYLEKKHGATGCRFSSILRQKFGEDILAKAIASDAIKLKSNIVVVDGVRRMADIKFLKNTPGFYLVAVDAEPKILYPPFAERRL